MSANTNHQYLLSEGFVSELDILQEKTAEENWTKEFIEAETRLSVVGTWIYKKWLHGILHEGVSDFYAAVVAGDEPLVSRLLFDGWSPHEVDVMDGISALHAAIRMGHLPVVIALLEAGVTLTEGYRGQNVFHAAVGGWNPFSEINGNYFPMLEYHLRKTEAPILLEAIDQSGKTPYDLLDESSNWSRGGMIDAGAAWIKASHITWYIETFFNDLALREGLRIGKEIVLANAIMVSEKQANLDIL